jgi:hypothetical protein
MLFKYNKIRMLLQKLFHPIVSPLNPIYNTTPYKAKNLLIFGPE